MASDVDIRVPVGPTSLERLALGDMVYISGRIFTARDRAHKRMVEYLRRGKTLPFDLAGGVVYHCGPIVKEVRGTWQIVSAGPTTSSRFEVDVVRLVEPLGFKIVLGKGGLGQEAMRMLSQHGSIYCAITGGAGALWARKVKKVVDVHWLDLGTPEAVWELEVARLGPAFVASNLRGRSLYEEVRKRVKMPKPERVHSKGTRVINPPLGVMRTARWAPKYGCTQIFR